MARPSKTYPSERTGRPCGASWPDPLRVNGKIPGIPFGAQYDVTLQPVALSSEMRANQGMISWRGEHEARVRQKLEDTIDSVTADAQKFRWRIGDENYQAIRNLLALALAELAYVDITHETWSKRRWALDRLTYAPECDRRGGLGPGEVFGGGFDRCPTLDEIELRIEAREFILERFVDACHFIRCAQYGLWRVWLYRRARDEWKTTPQGGAPDGLAPTPPKSPRPKTGPTDFTAKPPSPPPPPVPPKPDPPPFPPDLGGELPDPGEPDPPNEDDVPSPPLPPPAPDPTPEPEPEPLGEPVGQPSPEEGEEDEPLAGDEPLGAEPFHDAPLGPGVDYGSWAHRGPGPVTHWPDSRMSSATEAELVHDVGAELIDAGESTAKSFAVAAAVTKVATAAVVVGGVVGVTYLVTRSRKK